jgi:Zn-dependent protease
VDGSETSQHDADSPDGSLPSNPETSRPLTPAEHAERLEHARKYLQKRMRRMLPLAIFLFVATCFSTYVAGISFDLGAASQAQQAAAENLPDGAAEPAAPPAEDFSFFKFWPLAMTYAAAVMGTLLAHELGHFVQAVRYRVPASPPMFIPMPISPTGTMGAVIVQGGGFADRKALFDIAISGPLAGLVLALPICWFGMTGTEITTMDPAQFPPGQAVMVFGNPPLFDWLIELYHGPLAVDQDISLTPLLFAGWVGIFVTALNLLPIGQLDGGHILYTLIGRRAHTVAVGLIIAAGVTMYLTDNLSYLVFLILLLFFGPKHPPTANDNVPLGRGRIILGWLTLAFIFVGFTTNPFQLIVPNPAPIPAVQPNDDPGLLEADMSIRI